MLKCLEISLLEANTIVFRKVQKIGGKSFAVNLPMSWIKKLGIKKETILQIDEQDNGNLIIRPYIDNLETTSEVFEIKTSGSLSRDITRAYLLGYDKISIIAANVTGFSRQELDEIEHARAKFPGAEIMTEEKNRIIIEIIASADKNRPYNLIHTMFNLTMGMLERITNLLNQNKEKNRGEITSKDEIIRIRNIDQKVNRKYFLAVRQLRALIQNTELRKRQGLDTLVIMDYRLISHLLENIGDNCVRICDYLLEYRQQLVELLDKEYIPKSNRTFDALIAISKKIEDFHRETFNAFIHQDSKMAADLLQKTFGFPSEFDRYIADCKADPKKSNLIIILYRYYDIYSMLIDINDLIQPKSGKSVK